MMVEGVQGVSDQRSKLFVHAQIDSNLSAEQTRYIQYMLIPGPYDAVLAAVLLLKFKNTQ
jgi:hypothetical protein